ncbi:uncharacterized protein LOC135380569 [Ornithodoros turicata]|uniref:uncharacterized protein LOC135380569 n=1 Tax=Ornithodoros turicata TaxID=34597 RepID=UPI003138FBE0
MSLTGEALAVFARLTPDDSVDYTKVKNALLQRFRLTADGFREKFRSSKPEEGETGTQYAARIGSLFDRWVELSNTKKEYPSLREMLIMEQFVKGCPPKLALFLKERTGGSLEEMAALADRFMEAQGQMHLGKPKLEEKRQEEQPGPRPNGKSPADRRNQPRCYLCDRLGHRASECRSSNTRNQKTTVTCGRCGKRGHLSEQCWSKTQEKNQAACVVAVQPDESEMAHSLTKGYVELKDGQKIPVVNAMMATETQTLLKGMPVRRGKIKGQEISVLRDTGSNTVVVRKSLVSEDEMTGTKSPVYLVDGTIRVLPEAIIVVQTPFYCGEVVAKCTEEPLYDLILGNICNVREADNPIEDWEEEMTWEQTARQREDSPSEHNSETNVVAAMETRSQRRRRGRRHAARLPRLPAPTADGEAPTTEEIVNEQANDSSLKCCFSQVGKRLPCRNEAQEFEFRVHKGLLYRHYFPTFGGEVEQLVLPSRYRNTVLQIAHEGIMAGHMGVKKTMDRILEEFFWPGMQAEVQRFVRSCDICQRTTPKGRVGKVPLGQVPTIDTPFRRVAVDIIGPISPPSSRGNRYVLTMVDYATRFPDAVALPSIETERVAEALVEMFARTGIPSEVLSDRGTNFTSDVMKEVSRLLSLKQLHTTPHHPMGNGLVERFNGTLKTMLKRMCQERPKDWDRYLAPVLFAYREVPQASLGFSPFELIYGRHVRGPLSVLKELWTNEAIEGQIKTTYQYVMDLRNRLEETCKLAHQELQNASNRYKRYYNKRSRARKLNPGDQVLILLPTDQNKLLMQWKGPFPVVSHRNEVDYEIDLGHRTRLFHINMLKKYEERPTTTAEPGGQAVCAVVTMSETDGEPGLQVLSLQQKETFRDVSLSSDLSKKQKEQVREVLDAHRAIFSDAPGKTDLIRCDLKLTTEKPINTKQYPLPFAVREAIEEEVQAMLRMGIVERSDSAYNSPLLVVRKPDKTHRVCIDFRRLNDHLTQDSEPIPRADELFAAVGTKRYFTKLDFSKGYWQIPLTEDSKEKTAFSTESGLYQFKYMPFGIKTAPAIFTRLMRKLIGDIPDVVHYYDDVLIASNSWEDHLTTLSQVFQRIKSAGLTVRPTKCEIGAQEVSFLGHRLANGTLAPLQKTLERVLDANRPETIRQVRSFLGLAGYYREFIPDYAKIAAPLTDLTKKGKGNRVAWGPEQEEAFNELKKLLSSAPILKLPDFTRPFVIRTDASGRSLGAILLQEENGVLHPVSYASRKLLPREAAYSTVEREGLALVWGIDRYKTYLYGRHFTVQTDHQPLQYLKKQKHLNSRLLRWSLMLQEHSFRVEYIKGSENVGADYLSRI